MFYCLCFSSITLILNIINMFMLIRHKYFKGQKIKNDKGMVVCTVFVYINEVFIILSQYVFVSEVFAINFTLRFVIPYITETHYLLPGVIIVITVSPLRKIAFGALFGDREIKVTASAVGSLMVKRTTQINK